MYIGTLLKYVKDQTPEICLAAVRNNEKAVYYVRDDLKEEVLRVLKEEI